MISNKYSIASAAAVAIILWVALAAQGGPLNGFDRAAIDSFAARRAAYPLLTHAGIWISLAGSAQVTLGLAVLGAAFLLRRRRYWTAGALLAVVLGGRMMVEILKLWIGRPRPDLDFPVAVHSLSFPSGHATNSMVTFVALALFLTPERHRATALALAIAASVLVGVTRPLLGVHWPSDVLAGWILGLLWTLGGWWLTRKLDPPSRG